MKRRFRSEFAIAGRVNSGHFLEVFACLALFYETHFPQRHSATTTITTTTTTTTTTFAPITSTLPSLFAGQFSAISAPIELGQNSRIYNRSNASCVTRWKILVRYTILLRAVNSSRRFRGWNAITLIWKYHGIDKRGYMYVSLETASHPLDGIHKNIMRR